MSGERPVCPQVHNYQGNSVPSNTGATFAASTNQMSGAQYVYDAASDVTYDGLNSYLYDAEGRICVVQSAPIAGSSALTAYLYNAEGQRVEKGTPTKCTSAATCSCDPSSNGFQMTENYVLGPGGEELTMLDGQGNWQRSYVYANGKLIATYDMIQDPMNSNPGTIAALHFQVTDPLGTRRVQTDPVGQRETDCQSLPFGDFLNCFTDPNAPDTADDATPLHFTGKERDAESGNDYFEARYYSSAMGRFMSPDWSAKAEPVPYSKLDDPQSLNLYAYVGNNPLIHIDVDGHCAVGPGLPDVCQPIMYRGQEQQSGQQAQQQNGSSKGTGFWSSLGQRFSNFFSRHGFKTNMELTPVVTHQIFFSASAEAGPLSQSVSYVPSTNNLYYSPGVGTGSGVSLTAGWATDANGFAGGPSGSVCFFAGVGGCGGISTSGDYAGQVGVGIGGWGAAAGYGVDPIQTIGMGMVNGEPVDPLATKVGDVYMEDPQMWIPQN